MVEHQAVLANESIDGLNIDKSGLYIDGTFGRGGHSRAILNKLGPNGRLIAFDKDPEAVAYAATHFSSDKRFEIVHASFAELYNVVKEKGLVGQINGILLDLGVSSPQIDKATRGFSFMQNGPLDMRMNLEQSLTAASFVNEAKEDLLVSVFREYGEERFALRIARAIIRQRENAPFKTTMELAEIIKAANPKWEKHKHPATRVFQAIRIYINKELDDLSSVLEQSMEVLAVKGRLVVISFHSLEDRMVKHFMQRMEKGDAPPKGIPVREDQITTCFKRIGKVIKPHDDEIANNARARSAVLRIGEKIK